ncbi:FAD-dependent monooxygenase [Kribbella sp. NBC_00382]|uniref:FAD-dependent oxidoreductase n=1 Tax=Kribbella sp. NBC_00382 TaxID=2975967 RepID=UPI002E22BF3C
MSTSLQVAIVGGGIGGLALAQGLTKAGVSVQLYERDESPLNRKQGYRIHISPVGEEALAAVLPAEVLRRVVETSSHAGDLLGGFDGQLNPTFEQTFPGAGPDTVSAVDRYAFRRALMTGLDGVLEFGREFESYRETADGRVELRFTDGTSATADVLVGADGIGSRVRAQLLPDFPIVDIGVRCVYGKIPLTDAIRSVVPAAFLRGFNFVTDGAGPGLAFAPVLFRTAPAEYGDYLMAVLTGTNEVLGVPDEELFALSPEGLWDLVVRRTRDWHPTIQRLVAAADVGASFPITLRTSTRIEPWQTGRVTLLGDAIHPMTPAAGAGANTALWDAARLTQALVAGDLATYESEMIENGRAVVEESLRNAERMFGVQVAA